MDWHGHSPLPVTLCASLGLCQQGGRPKGLKHLGSWYLLGIAGELLGLALSAVGIWRCELVVGRSPPFCPSHKKQTKQSKPKYDGSPAAEPLGCQFWSVTSPTLAGGDHWSYHWDISQDACLARLGRGQTLGSSYLLQFSARVNPERQWWCSATHMGDLNSVPRFCFVAGPTPGAARTRGVNEQVGAMFKKTSNWG